MTVQDNGVQVPSTSTPARGTPRLATRQLFGYGAGDTAYNLTFSLAISFLPVYYTDVALISPAIVGVIFLVMRFVDAFTDILIGSVVDRTSTRMGKFRPYILFGSVPLILTTVLAFAMPGSLHGTGWAVVWAAVTYFLMGSVFATIVNIPYGSLASAMTDNPDERARLALFRTLGSAVMQVAVAVAISPVLQANEGDPEALQSSLIWTISLLGIAALGLYLFLFFTSRENVERKQKRVSLREALGTLRMNRALQMLGLVSVIYLVGLFGFIGVLVYYVRDILGDARYMAIFAVVLYGMIIAFGWAIPALIRRLGKPRLFQLGAVVGVVGSLLFLLAPDGVLWVGFVAAVLVGTSSGLVNTLMWNLEADSVDYGEWQSGLRTEGTTYAVFSFVRKLAQALGGAIGVWIIGWFGYQGGAEMQSDSALWGIRVATGAIPAVCFGIAAVLMIFYPLNDAKFRRIQAELDHRGEVGDDQSTSGNDEAAHGATKEAT